MSRSRGSLLAAVAAVLTLVLAGCGSGASSGSNGSKLRVLAASSLTGSFGQLATSFHRAHPSTEVSLVLDSSGALVQSLQQGAPGGVLATADKKTMDAAVAAKSVTGPPQVFATNTMVLVVPKANPAHIRRFSDLDKPGVKYLTCVTSAPCGDLGTQLLTADHVTAKPASQETDVKSVLAKIVSGEADAGLVYHTDALSESGKVTEIPIPGAAQKPNPYYVAVTADAPDPKVSREWIDLLLSRQGQKVLVKAGFGHR